MTSNVVYMVILGSLQVGLLLFYLIIFTLLGLKSTYFSIVGYIFGIYQVSNHNEVIILDMYGTRVNFLAHKRFRLVLKLIVLVCFFIISVVFVDGCILSTEVLTAKGMCPKIPPTDCFYFESHLIFKARPFQCPSSESVSAANITGETMICYTWVIKSQSIISILNQLGICSSILPLLGGFFRCLYHLARRRCWGIFVTIMLGLVIVAIPLILWTVCRVHVSFIATFFIGAAIVLLLTVLFLVHTISKLDHQVAQRHSIAMDRKYVEP